jgi:branched-chain amino acid transport system substrate-binding protein
MRRILAYLVLFSIVLLSHNFACAEPIKIGVVGPLTGPVAVGGLHTRNGLELAKEEVDKKGGVPGVGNFELIYEDDKCVPPESVNAVTKLVHRDKVLAVIGSVCSSATLASMAVTEKAKTPQITTVSSAPAITQKGNPWIFRTALADSLRAEALAEFAVKTLKAKVVGIIHDADDYGKDGADAFIAKFKTYNIQPKVNESFNRKDIDFSGQLMKVKNAGADLLIIWGLPEESSLILKQIKDMNLNVRIMGGDAMANPRTSALAGPAIDGVFSAIDFVRTDKSPTVQEFVKKYESKFNTPSDNVAANAYESVYMLKTAITKSGLDKNKLRQTLLDTKFDEMTGVITFDKNGENLRRPNIVVIKNGTVYKYE